MKILGIDPGTSRIGYGLIEEVTEPKLLRYGTIESTQKDFNGKIVDFSKKFSDLLQSAQPEMVAIEKIFFTKNQKTAISVAQARGILVAKCLENNIKVIELGPMEVKQSITGYGLTDKKGVALMVKRILNIKELKGYDDASDAIAIALAGSQRRRINEA